MVNIAIDTQSAGGVADRKLTKSTVGALSLFGEDLLGCGPKTHVRMGLTGAFNARNQCSPPSPFYQRSMSAILALNTFILDRYDEGPNTTARPEGGLFLTQLLGGLNVYLAGALASQFPNAAAYNVSPAEGFNLSADAFVRRGGQWISNTIEGRTLLVDAVRLSSQTDICDRIVGVKASASASFTVKDKFCVPQLIAQASVNIIISGPDSPVTDTAWGTTAPTDGPIAAAYLQSRMQTVEGQAIQGSYVASGNNVTALGATGAALVPIVIPVGTVLQIGATDD